MLRRDFEEGRKVVLQTQIFCFCLKTTFIHPEKSRFILYYNQKKSMIEKPLFSNQKKIRFCIITFLQPLAHSKSFLRMQIKRLIGYHWESFGHLLKILVEDPFGIRWGPWGSVFAGWGVQFMVHCWVCYDFFGEISLTNMKLIKMVFLSSFLISSFFLSESWCV